MAVFEAKNLAKRFGGLLAVHDLSFQVEQGEVFGIIGPNGAGKTTLFNMTSGLLKPDSGQLWFKNQNITVMPPFRRCHMGISRTFQIMQPFGNMSVRENVMVMALFGNAKTPSMGEAGRMADEILDLTGLHERAHDSPSGLTTAGLKRLEIARSLANGPQLLLLDEVMSGLNPTETAEAMRLISKIAERGITVLLIEHVMAAVRDLCTRVLVMHYGEKLAEGPYSVVAAKPEVIEAYLGEEAGHEQHLNG